MTPLPNHLPRLSALVLEIAEPYIDLVMDAIDNAIAVDFDTFHKAAVLDMGTLDPTARDEMGLQDDSETTDRLIDGCLTGCFLGLAASRGNNAIMSEEVMVATLRLVIAHGLQMKRENEATDVADPAPMPPSAQAELSKIFGVAKKPPTT